jgi:toxin CcdB
MAQFDVHRNRGRNNATIPFVVIVQSARFDTMPSRLVAPLVSPRPGSHRVYPDLAPEFIVEDQRVVLDALVLQTVPRESLGPLVASLADDASSDRIIKAIDLVITRAYG